jgi:hypothetical protein
MSEVTIFLYKVTPEPRVLNPINRLSVVSRFNSSKQLNLGTQMIVILHCNQ